MAGDSSDKVVLRDVYIVTHIFSPTANVKGTLRRHAFPGVPSHYSLLTQDHVFHVTSEFASNKLAYFKRVARGEEDVPLRLKISDLSTDSPKDRRYRVLYCGCTPYRIPHIRFYAEFVLDLFGYYSISFANCLDYVVILAALIVNGETQSIMHRFIGTLEEIAVQEDHRRSLRRAGQRLPFDWRILLNVKSSARVWRVRTTAWLVERFHSPRLCPLASPPRYNGFPSHDGPHRKREKTAWIVSFKQFRPLIRKYKNTSRCSPAQDGSHITGCECEQSESICC